jgi:LPXTG-motif cell wall-anchored protein
MDFIERLFGLSPDNGDGSTEILWLVVLAILIAAFFYFRRRRRKAKQIFRR